MRAILAAVLLWMSMPALSHEVRPGYLELSEHRADEYAVLWKTPMRGDLRLALTPEFSVATEKLGPVVSRSTGEAAIQTWRIKSLGPLRGGTVRIAGLESTITDVVVRAEFLDGSSWTHRLTPANPSVVMPVRDSGFDVARVYLGLGVEHILLGFDHLLFVLALLLVIRGNWELVQAVTAFTVAHSITLALAALGVLNVPAAPVEAVIAVSIAFVAAEVVRVRRGTGSAALYAPWVIAFVFGLVHGLGFAGALSEMGLPRDRIVLALLLFNVGVELGQLLFIAAVLGALKALRLLDVRLPRRLELLPPYVIGSTAMFWVVQRLAAF